LALFNESNKEVNSEGITYKLVTVVLRAALLAGLFTAGWLVYMKVPRSVNSSDTTSGQSMLYIVLRQSSEMNGLPLDIPIELYPVDVVAVRHEYFTERRAGKRFEDFLNERMNGRTQISTRLDKQGHASVMVGRGSWWIHALLPGDENLEWRLGPIDVTAQRETVELTPHNAYIRTKSF
jgi:hypothetical protein